jgi:hypothetical protein
MKKFFGVAIAVVLLATVTFAAPGAKHKATGDADWTNDVAFNQPANLTFNAINTTADGLEAKGSAIYTDANITYTMDVKFLKVSGNTAWFAGTVTSFDVTGTDPQCCRAGNWIFYKVVDGGEPGIGVDEVWGEDLTAGPGHITSFEAVYNKVFDGEKPQGGPFVLTGGNLQVR